MPWVLDLGARVRHRRQLGLAASGFEPAVPPSVELPDLCVLMLDEHGIAGFTRPLV